MPEYYFNARDQQGKALSGQRNAISAEDLANQLISEGLIPLDISVSTGKKSSTSSVSSTKKSWFDPKVTLNDLHIFCHQMYSLIHAGIPIASGITRLAETTRNKTLAEALQKVVISLNKGSSLNMAMRQFPNIFSDFFLNLIVIGENTGNLDKIFLHLAEYLEMEVDITKKIKSALRYPLMVIGAIIIALLIINVFVIPAFAKLYANMHGILPLPTRILLTTSNFIIHYWYILIGIVVFAIWAIRSYIHSPKGAVQWGKFQLKIPVIGWLIHRILLTRFARLLSLVLRAGITAVDGIQMVGASTNNAYMSLRIQGVTDLIAKGNTISSAIDKTNLFPPLIIQMIVLGEESGTIDHLLDEVAEYYQREINYDIVRISDTIEPILLVIIGGMVLILALGVFLPTWNLASLVKQQ
ncbi:MSHA biogenesis protein MshG [Legionella qingyii]|uniref:MSHA biogenesis protein MshG n=1 Tax=Legionella qingyii TaxID=2184757 RepID=A0A317U0J7_9GAMM|nr:type II secretion system F family protein [Legionella qingyii]PWY55361.1 MSHA biogenesis protein MshG [Legionella qingyii]RUR21238.1 type II secretion system F family protein [Legionella qingyii]RUR23971.1 type II secretion system F family protein [Legionella qingyii]